MPFIFQNSQIKTTKIMTGVNLTPVAILKILNVKCHDISLKQVVQVIDVNQAVIMSEWCEVILSDGSACLEALITHELLSTVKELQKSSIVQLTGFAFRKMHLNSDSICIYKLNVIRTKCDIIGDPKPFTTYEIPRYKISKPFNKNIKKEILKPPISNSKNPLFEISKSPLIGLAHSKYGHNEDVDNSHHAEEPSASIKLPPTSTLKCSSCSQTQGIKRKYQSSDQEMLAVAKDIPKVASMMIEKNKEDDIGACFEKLEKIGWRTEDPLYDTALLLFGESVDYRKLWLLLKPESCGKWVKNAGSKFGLLG